MTQRVPTSSGRFEGLSYTRYGEGRPVIAVHGFGETAFSWRGLIAALPAGVSLYAFDLRGCGQSDKPRDSRYTLHDQAAIIRRFIEARDFAQPGLIGHSMGGGIALLTALDLIAAGRTLGSLVLIDSIAFPQPLPWFIRLLRTPGIGALTLAALPPATMVRIVMSWAFSDPRKIDAAAVRDYAGNLATPDGRHAQLQIANNIIPSDIDDIIARYPTIAAPTLIVVGGDDRIVPPENGAKLNAAIPRSRLLVVPSCGHIPHEERPEAVIPAICAFLSDPQVAPR